MIRRCPRYPKCLVATTIEERRYCPTHGARLVVIERTCPACSANVMPEDRFCVSCGAAQEPEVPTTPPSPTTTTTAPHSDTPNDETCVVYDWLFRQPNGARLRLADLIVERRAREPKEIRAALRALVWADSERELRDTLFDVALDRVDWDQLVEDYLERVRRDAYEDRAEAQAEDRA